MYTCFGVHLQRALDGPLLAVRIAGSALFKTLRTLNGNSTQALAVFFQILGRTLFRANEALYL